MPAEIVLSRRQRVNLYSKISIGDRIRITGGKNKGMKGTITNISYPNDECYGDGKYEFNHYFSVFFRPDGGGKIKSTSCNYTEKIKE